MAHPWDARNRIDRLAYDHKHDRQSGHRGCSHPIERHDPDETLCEEMIGLSRDDIADDKAADYKEYINAEITNADQTNMKKKHT